MTHIMPRRSFLRLTLLSGAAVGTVLPSLVKAAAEACAQDTDVEGPYYLPDARFETKTGNGLSVSGTVLDEATCLPIKGAVVERWHSSPYGYYEDYYRCKMTSDANGKYAFQTRLPGIYGARPRHIHYRVTAPGYQELITQSYFPQEQAGGLPESQILFDLVLKKA